MGYIYIVRKGVSELKETNHYKIGKTSESNPVDRVKKYEKGYSLKFVIPFHDENKAESDLIEILKKDHGPAIDGTETFDIELEKMIEIILAYRKENNKEIAKEIMKEPVKVAKMEDDTHKEKDRELVPLKKTFMNKIGYLFADNTIEYQNINTFLEKNKFSQAYKHFEKMVGTYQNCNNVYWGLDNDFNQIITRYNSIYGKTEALYPSIPPWKHNKIRVFGKYGMFDCKTDDAFKKIKSETDYNDLYKKINEIRMKEKYEEDMRIKEFYEKLKKATGEK